MSEYGKVQIGSVYEPTQKELNIIDFIRADYKDHRLISVSKLENDTYTIVVENYDSSGRSRQQGLYLSEESFVGFIATSILYFQMKGIDFQSLLTKAMDKDNLNYSYSDNLKPFEVEE